MRLRPRRSRPCFKSRPNASVSLSELDHINPAHTISAALCYATQLLTVLSHILDVGLPKKLCNRCPGTGARRREDRPAHPAAGSWFIL